jgi:hypothetical protein
MRFPELLARVEQIEIDLAWVFDLLDRRLETNGEEDQVLRELISDYTTKSRPPGVAERTSSA